MQSNAGSGRIFFLQALRGAAAVIVMVYHLALKFWTTHDALAVSFPGWQENCTMPRFGWKASALRVPE